MLPKRLDMDYSGLGVKGLVSLGRSDYHSAQGELGEHLHAGMAEICYLGRGRQEFIIGGRGYSLRGGDVLFSQPDEVHSSGGRAMEHSRLYWLILDLKAGAEGFLDLPQAEADVLYSALCRQRTAVTRGGVGLPRYLEELTRCYLEGGAFRRTRIRMLVTGFLLDVLEHLERGESVELSDEIQSVLALIERAETQWLTLERMAREAGLSLSHFKQRFQREIGMPPGEYLLRHKVEVGQRRLQETDESITRIAYGLGFSSSQYFATVFKRFVGKRPGEMRE